MGEYNLTDKMYRSYTETSRGDNTLFSQQITYGDSALNDAFGRLRMSLPETVFDNFEIQGKKTLFWTERTTGTVSCTHVANQSAVQFSASMTSGNRITRSSKKLSLYTPGNSLMILATGVMGSGQTGSAERIGFFDDSNGVFYEQKDGAMGVVIRTSTSGSVANNRIEQADWNIDTMDGTGPSGIDLDYTKTQIFWFDLEWLGVGRVRCGFVHRGLIYVCHEFYHNNNLSTVYMSTPLLPMTYQVENLTAVSTALTDFRQICCSVVREGGDSTTHKHRSLNAGVAPIAVTSTSYIPIISLRIQSAYVGKGMIKPNDINVYVQGNKDCMFEVLYNATVTGGTFVTAPSGIAAYNITATDASGGVKMATLYTASTDKANSTLFDKQFWIGGELSGVPDNITVVAKAITGLTGTALAAIDYQEIY